MLAERGVLALDLAQVRGLIGQGPRSLLAQAFERADSDIDEADLSRLTERFLDLYHADIARQSRPFPGVEAALAILVGEGAGLAVCTNKSASLTLALLDALNLSQWFTAIATPETAGAAKPDPAHLLAAIEGAGGRPDRAVMVGDSVADAGAARRACVPLILVDFGYADRPAAALEPDVLIGHFSELPGAVARLLRPGAEAIAPSPAADA